MGNKRQRYSREIYAHRILRKFFFQCIRPFSLKSMAQRFFNLGLSIEEAKRMPFEELLVSIRRDEAVDSSGDMLLRLMQLCNWNRGDAPLITGTVNVKVFLVSYLIVAKPANVFETPDLELEKNLLEISEPFLVCFHEAVDAFREGKGWASLKESGLDQRLTTSLCDYLRSFKVSFPFDD